MDRALFTVLLFLTYSGLACSVWETKSLRDRDPPSVECPPDCDFDAKAVSEVHTRAWHKAYVGTPLDDAELQALSDAQEILRCLAAS